MKNIINSPSNNYTSPFTNNAELTDFKRKTTKYDSKEIEDEGEFIDYNNVTGLRLTDDNNKLNKFNDVYPEMPTTDALRII